MRFAFLLLLFPLLWSCSQVSESEISTYGKYSKIEMEAPSLSNNILGISTKKSIGVYLPPSYNSELQKKYPVIYFLEGYGVSVGTDSYVAAIADTLFAEKKVPEAICVILSGSYYFKGSGSFYANSPVTGNWRDFVTKDVVQYIDANYRTIAQKDSRAIAGHSMGGFGVLNIAAHHPDVFATAFSMSPGLFTPEGQATCHTFKPRIRDKVIALQQKLASMNKVDAKKYYYDYANNLKDDWELEFTLAYGMCFAPRTDKVPYFDYPYKLVSGDTVFYQDIWEKWDSGFGQVEQEIVANKEQLKALKALTLECGYNDDFAWIYHGTWRFAEVLNRERIPFQLQLHQGTHGSLYTESLRNRVFPTVAATLEY